MTSRFSLRKWPTLFAALAVAALALIGSFCGRGVSATRKGSPEKLTLGQLFRAGQPKELNGKPARTAEFAGKPVVLVFWDAWCGGCREAVPLVNRLREKYQKRGVKVIGVSVATSPQDAKRFAREQQVKYPLFIGNRKMADLAGVIFMPTALFFDGQGGLLKRLPGAPTEKALAETIDPLLQPGAGK